MIGPLRAWRRRAVLGLMWIRYVHPVRWAHHPVCERFRPDLIRLGRVYVCRSCAMLYLSLLATAAACLFFRETTGRVAAPAFFSLAAITLTGSFPVWYKRWPRPIRDALRATLGATLALCGLLLIEDAWPLGLIGLAVLWAAYRVFGTLRRAGRLAACDGCPELAQPGVCSGCRLQVDLARRYETAATAWLLADGFAPSVAGTRQDGRTQSRA